MELFSVYAGGGGGEVIVQEEDYFEAMKFYRHVCRQGYLSRNRFKRSMKPLFGDGMCQVAPGISIELYVESSIECPICDEQMVEFNPDYLNATLVHCKKCVKTFIRRRDDSA